VGRKLPAMEAAGIEPASEEFGASDLHGYSVVDSRRTVSRPTGAVNPAAVAFGFRPCDPVGIPITLLYPDSAPGEVAVQGATVD